jgi:hypothetical protein
VTVRDWIVIVMVVCVPLAAALLRAEILDRRDRRRWRDSAPIEDGRLNGRARS